MWSAEARGCPVRGPVERGGLRREVAADVAT